MSALQFARAAFPRRVVRRRWTRYWIDLAHASPAPSGVHLVPVTDALVAALRLRPDRAESDFKAGLRFWDEGLRRAYAWIGDEGPLCIQWLLTSEDNGRLRRLRDGAGMYPPLAPGWGRTAHLYVLSAARLPSIPTDFQRALFQEARRDGLKYLTTLVREGSAVGSGWAERAGWRRDGTVTRYDVGWRPRLVKTIYLHHADARRARAVVPADQQARARASQSWERGEPSAAAGS